MKDKGVLIGMLCTVVVVMAVAFAAFSTSLQVNGTATIASTWKVAFDKSNSSCSDGSNIVMNGESTLATIGVSLETPGDSVTCTLAVKNSGTLDAYLKSINVTPTGDAPITFTVEPSTTALATRPTLAANGGVEYIKLTATYDADTEGQPEDLTNSVVIVANYEQKLTTTN
ncbi:MAG: hypothetical protein IJO43_04245 [Bacilli bacterium]|nr:hypothetical protein [Bacilli bacterium]